MLLMCECLCGLTGGVSCIYVCVSVIFWFESACVDHVFGCASASVHATDEA